MCCCSHVQGASSACCRSYAGYQLSLLPQSAALLLHMRQVGEGWLKTGWRAILPKSEFARGESAAPAAGGLWMAGQRLAGHMQLDNLDF